SHPVRNFHSGFNGCRYIRYTAPELNAYQKRYWQAVGVRRFILIEYFQADVRRLASGISRYKGCSQPEYFQNSYSICHFASPLLLLLPDYLFTIAILSPVIARLVSSASLISSSGNL